MAALEKSGHCHGVDHGGGDGPENPQDRLFGIVCSRVLEGPIAQWGCPHSGGGALAARRAKAAGHRADQHFLGSYVVANQNGAALNSL